MLYLDTIHVKCEGQAHDWSDLTRGHVFFRSGEYSEMASPLCIFHMVSVDWQRLMPSLSDSGACCLNTQFAGASVFDIV